MIRVLIADDHPAVREGLRAVIDRESDVRVAAEVADGSAALRESRTRMYDALVLDVNMPGMGGIEVLSRLRAEGISTPALLISLLAEHRAADRALRHGASGYLAKERAAEELVPAIRAIAAGRTYVSALTSSPAFRS